MHTRRMIAAAALLASGWIQAEDAASGKPVLRAVIDTSSCTRPEWPEGARDAGKTGTVTLYVLIGTDGKVKDSRVSKSSGHADLDEAARSSLIKCTYRPGIADGKPVTAWMGIQYVWTAR